MKILLPPPAQAPLVLMKAKNTYKVWHEILIHVKRIDRYTIGIRIDDVFLVFLEHLFRTSFASNKLEKLSFVSSSIANSDLLKFLLQIAWEHEILDNKHYGVLMLSLDEVGRMLGGWKRQIENKTPAQ